MSNDVNDWHQEGRLFVWRYPNARKGWAGWHFTGDPAGCRSIRNLLDRMHGGGACHRTIKLSPVTEAILSVPNYKFRTEGRFEKLRLEYRPDFPDLLLEPADGALVMTVGMHRLRALTAAFAEVEIGLGDFGIPTSRSHKALAWMFWWMPSINYNYGRRL
ncbi:MULTISPECIES: hypothetical protein [Sphingobium]|uniref:Uncharacterized protein n=1 Tax=Sphingobium yanoikuyae ATCC 51230 TaxID=883163 RepID=K9CSZ8_SPHYA|nr:MULTISPECIES: hypothetical protein [Sphingobium]EKU74051.1 hypothetical protein HMPREF9718_03168 [Sphingobium yanoikuyae ATCC 51230]WQE07502.1 hypothetical protein U0025_01080 [Sphingobium yanoikuyae]SHM70593.1 hypothetical protein SAMN05518668_12111 [Sphingobium sp. YR657]